MCYWKFKQGGMIIITIMEEAEVQEVQADGSNFPNQSNKPTVVPIVIDSSSDQEPILIQKRASHPRFNFQRRFEIVRTETPSTIEYQPYVRPSQERILRVQETMHRTTAKDNEYRQLYNYRLLDSSANRFVCEVYLEERVKKYALEAREEEGERVGRERGKELRYFQCEEQSQNRLIKCFRCNKKGHTAKNCIVERPMFRCANCLGNHPHAECTSNHLRCFRCDEEGHLARHCFAENLACGRCGRNGHVDEDCGGVILQQGKGRDGVKMDKEDIARLRCLKGCSNPYGHFNCHKYSSFALTKPYKEADRPRPMRSQLLENKMCFTDCDGELAFVRTIPSRPSLPQRERRCSKW